jgi:hypothetical protein
MADRQTHAISSKPPWHEMRMSFQQHPEQQDAKEAVLTCCLTYEVNIK